MKKVVVIFIFLFGFLPFSFAQINFVVSDESIMTISGTSTIHDWTSKVNEIKGDFQFNDNIQSKKFPKSGSIVNHLEMILPVKSIESPRGATMDTKTYNALKSEEYPNIVFKLSSDEVIEIKEKSTDSFVLKVKGTLSMAGVTKDIELNLDSQRKSMNQLWFKGSFPIDMITYEIEPPSAMFGQIKTGKDVIIDFELFLNTN